MLPNVSPDDAQSKTNREDKKNLATGCKIANKRSHGVMQPNEKS
jgi:hypothetical protein